MSSSGDDLRWMKSIIMMTASAGESRNGRTLVWVLGSELTLFADGLFQAKLGRALQFVFMIDAVAVNDGSERVRRRRRSCGVPSAANSIS